MREQVWKAYAAMAGVAIGVFLFVPTDGWVRVGWEVAVGYAAVAAMIVGLRRNHRDGRALWWCFAIGVFGNVSGILVEQVDVEILHGDGFPSVADFFYLSLYPAAAVGLAILIRRRTARRDWGALVDATTVTTGLGLLAWVGMIRPLAADHSIGLLGHVVSVAYPVGDVVLVAMVVRLQVGGGNRTPSYWFMTGSLLTFLAGDTAWAVINALSWEPNSFATQILYSVFLVAYTLFGVASLHPSAREVGQRGQPAPPRLSRPLLALLTGASLIAPVVLAVQVANHKVTDGPAIVIGCVTLFLLVVTRMAQLLTQVEEQAKKVRELSRTDELTGLPNRRAWTAELPRAIERARRAQVPLSIAMVDLDHFKRFNDSYGHPAGDRLLKAGAAAWSAQLRATDHLARYGGEEFIALLSDADGAQAVEIMERLRAATPLGQTFSSGIATWDGRETSDEMIARADAALYDAKRAGRDRIVVAGGPQLSPIKEK
jgi:diguanylate cyclase (GGDEF)-like protein